MSIEINVDLGDTLARLDSILQNVESGITSVEVATIDMMEDMVIMAEQIWDAQGPHIYETGVLRGSIHYEGSFPQFQFIADATNDRGQQYARWIEFGTSKMQAQPFMWPAVYEALAVHIPMIKADFQVAIKGER